ncbi:two-component sensor histidine kinase BarA [Aeromonas jandaei]|uniref:histidine kinase n=1 Tax=Aeromonas jandaei TaxID=650 RepID=A0ABD7ESD5_AERJA|nr:two-component sensor histidine kinase BarA [Aeromonas jandaei]MBM0493154.1 two-component sensor histidine kinase BarA [Aeromonas jandaei]MBM0569812.1 two-component sensor histidine kinase BarA [Aeromonas jandaei]QWL60287.1 two-component sensor histidine kinase BarA [Aeromonas jandaei]QWL64080.1 two-component sensor histidine kinase BarA [Aeromonas jandaei]
MTKYGLRARVLAFTILPTLIIGGLMAGYFTFHRYQQLENNLIDQGINIIEPLAIASEYGMTQHSRESLKRLIGLTHRKNSPLIKSIAVFTQDNQLFVTSNYHRDFTRLQLPDGEPIPELTSITLYGDDIILRTPIQAETTMDGFPLPSDVEPPMIGYISMQMTTDRAMLLHYRDTFFAIIMVLLGVAVSTLFGFRLVKSVTQPITNMVQAVHKIREGRLDTRVSGELTGELDMLKNGINAMAKALSEYHEEMQQNIDQATSDLRETLEQIEIQNVELDMAKKRAQEAARVKSEFLANMSHELRTPLNGVIGFTRQLLKTSLTPSQTDYMQTIEKSARNLLGIINDILDFSKLEAGKLQLEHIPFSLRDTLNETMHLLGPSAHDKQLELSLRVDADVPDTLTGDPMRLQQVLTNLTGNAIKFTERGNVDVHIEQLGSSNHKVKLNVRIRDTGIGISEEQQRQLFQAFNQADSSISRRYGGTGLGLVITQKLVQQMGGQIRFESELDKGSVFSFSLDLEVSPLPQTDQLPLDRIRNKRLWLLEPDPFARAALLALLAEWQLDVQLLTNDAPWPEMSEQDIVLIGSSTLHTPQQVISRLDSLSGQQQNTIVLLSSHEPALYEAMLAHGAQHCLSKPLNHRKLLHALLTPEASRQQLPAQPSARQLQPIKVLAVDDNAANLKLIAAMLREMVTQVVLCKNGKEAVKQAQSQPFDIIFMDIQMPIMDGISATQAIRSQSLNTETPIVAVTAHAIPGERERLIRQGMDDYLAKPIDESMLARLITDFAHRRHQIVGDQQIDWALAVRQAAGKEDLAREMLTMLLASFDEVEPVLDAALAGAIDDSEVLAQLHRLNGGCAYSGVPGLQRLLSQLEQQLRDGVPVSELEPELLELQDALELVRQEAPRYLS